MKRKIKNTHTINLGPKDSAFVIRENGNQEIYIPPEGEGENGCIVDSAETILIIACGLDDEEIMERATKLVLDCVEKHTNGEIPIEEKMTKMIGKEKQND